MIFFLSISVWQQIVEFFSGIFSTDLWPPRWHCGRWSDFHGWLYIGSDLAIAAAYFTIPLLLIKLVTKKKGVPIPRLFYLFGAFILLCGLTHWVDALIFWMPVYRLSALLRLATAIVSVLTLFALHKHMDQALALKTSEEFENELIKRRILENSLIEAKNRAEESEHVKDRFLANMSHEIRTPMNSIIGFADLMETSPLTPTQIKYISAIKTSGKNLLVIINDILDFSKLDAGRLEIEKEPIDLHEVVHESFDLLKNKAKNRGLSYQLLIGDKVPHYFDSDRVRISQIIINLLSNAIKFTNEGRVNLILSLESENKTTSWIGFEVSDTGVGMDPDVLSSIFESFTQVKSAQNTTMPGTGLGLAISKNLVELMGGTITVSSEVNKGSVFTVKLPLAKNLGGKFKTKHLPIKANRKELKGSSILVAEDNKLNQELIKAVLGKFNVEVTIANNGQECVEYLKKTDFDLVLMDVQMPVLDGYDATEYIRQVLKSEVPIIAMTANALKSQIEKCIAVGMNDCITKPFEFEDLNTKLAFFIAASKPKN